jgi:hypothetical protein
MSDVLDNSYQYTVMRDVQIQTIIIHRVPNKRMEIEIITEDGSSTPTLLNSSGFTQSEVRAIMDDITNAL